MNGRVLVTGDLHLGRRPSRVSDRDLAERASAARMWGAIVSRAISLQVDAVMLSGDIVDHDNRFYEATGPLERGILTLAESGIHTFAVAGNHDWDVFPRILNQLDTPLFHYLGAGGRWEQSILERDGQPVLRILGWSFPAASVDSSPLDDFPSLSDSRLPTVGLLHADLDVPDSRYAPVRLADLQSRPVSVWVLGHVHKPQHRPSETGADVLYPGSPQAFDPGETGPHGPWLIELDGFHDAQFRHLPMSLVRYEEQEVDLSSAKTEVDFEARVNDALTSALGELGDDDFLQLLVLRLTFTGATPLCRRIDQLADQLGELERHGGTVRARIDKCFNQTRPPVNLKELARNHDPAGTLARLLLSLNKKEPDESLSPLLQAVMTRLEEVHRAAAYGPLSREPSADREKARKVLLQQGRMLLDALLRQRPELGEESA